MRDGRANRRDSSGAAHAPHRCRPRENEAVRRVDVVRRQWSYGQWISSGSDGGVRGIPGGSDASRDVVIDSSTAQDDGYANCVDDEALDVDYDKLMGIDCNGVRAAIDARRTSTQRENVGTMAMLMHNAVRRCCVSREQLVNFMRSPESLAPRFTVDERREADRVAGSLLCDRLTRETKTRLYLARNPSCLLGEVPIDAGGPSDIFDGGVSAGGDR